MRTLPRGLQAHLDSGATTLCRCWMLTTRAGEAMGFTDHDQSLSFAGVSFEPEAGFAATEIDSALGLAVDNLEAHGALSSARIDEPRLLAGDFDGAAVSLWLVNWQDTEQRVLLRKGHLGEVTRSGRGFAAELRGLAHVLNQPRGRIYQAGCDALLGDERCGVDLAEPAYRAAVTVIAAEDGRRMVVAGAERFVAHWFTRGRAILAAGERRGEGFDITSHLPLPDGAAIALANAMPGPPTRGDALILEAGCDRRFSTCREKFANTVRFRGFPHIPGDDAVLRYATRKTARDNT